MFYSCTSVRKAISLRNQVVPYLYDCMQARGKSEGGSMESGPPSSEISLTTESRRILSYYTYWKKKSLSTTVVSPARTAVEHAPNLYDIRNSAKKHTFVDTYGNSKTPHVLVVLGV